MQEEPEVLLGQHHRIASQLIHLIISLRYILTTISLNPNMGYSQLDRSCCQQPTPPKIGKTPAVKG